MKITVGLLSVHRYRLSPTNTEMTVHSEHESCAGDTFHVEWIVHSKHEDTVTVNGNGLFTVNVNGLFTVNVNGLFTVSVKGPQ